MAIQFLCMIIHRLGSLHHICTLRNQKKQTFYHIIDFIKNFLTTDHELTDLPHEEPHNRKTLLSLPTRSKELTQYVHNFDRLHASSTNNLIQKTGGVKRIRNTISDIKTLTSSINSGHSNNILRQKC